MYVCLLRCVVLASFSLAALPLHVVAQDQPRPDLVIYYDHTPDVEPTLRAKAEPPLVRDLRRDPPGRIPLAQGSRVCFVVVNSNPVLYSYSLASETIATPSPAGLSEFLAGLTPLVAEIQGGPGIVGRGIAMAEAPNLDAYYQEVATLFALLTRTQAAKLRSDTEADFNRSVQLIRAKRDSANNLNAVANETYESLQRAGAGSADLAMLRAIQLDASKRIEAINQEFTEAASEAGKQLCETVDQAIVRVRLKIDRKAAVPEGTQLIRPTGNVYRADFEPVSVTRFTVGFGGIISTLVKNKRSFSLEDGKISSQVDHSPDIRFGVFAMARPWDVPWMWGTVAFAVDDGGIADLFFGFTGRFGSLAVGPELSIGLGLVLSKVPLRVEQSDAGELPTDLSDLNDLVEREFRPGLGITFSISGFDWGDPTSGVSSDTKEGRP